MSRQIRQITAQGLTYADEAGEERTIDFAECLENRIRARPQSEARLRVSKEIGVRNPMRPPWGSGPYIELYTEPRIRLHFDTDDEYRTTVGAIVQAGWRLFDLS